MCKLEMYTKERVNCAWVNQAQKVLVYTSQIPNQYNNGVQGKKSVLRNIFGTIISRIEAFSPATCSGQFHCPPSTVVWSETNQSTALRKNVFKYGPITFSSWGKMVGRSFKNACPPTQVRLPSWLEDRHWLEKKSLTGY